MSKNNLVNCSLGFVITILLHLAVVTPTARGQAGIVLPGLGESASNLDITETGPPSHTPTAIVSITCCDPMGNPIIPRQGTPSEDVENLINDLVVFSGAPPNVTKWNDLQGDEFMIPVEIELEFPGIARYYTLTSANDVPERDPWEWRFLGSNVADPTPGDFVLLDERTGVDFSARHQTQLFGPIANDTPYATYRFEFETHYVAVGAANYPPGKPIPNSIQLAEIELFEVFAFVPEPNGAILLGCCALMLGLVRTRRG